MNKYKKEHLLNARKRFLKDLSNPAIFTRPWRIPIVIYAYLKKINSIHKNVVFKEDSVQELLEKEIRCHEALAAISVKYNSAKKNITDINEIFPESESLNQEARQLHDLLVKYGTDKGTYHYHIAYATFLKPKKNDLINILEIGLGTNNIDVKSNQGIDGKPGASLRAFRDMYKNAMVYGADIDKRILFEEERIKTFFVDQTNLQILDELKKQLQNIKFDLIIDDGLHNAHANLNTTYFALELLKDDGVFIIEDMSKDDFKYYQIAESVLKEKFTVEFVKSSNSFFCVFKRK